MANERKDRPRARVTMLIRASGADVLRAFVEPQQLQRFWLSKSSGPLTMGTAAHWEFMVRK